MNKQQLTHRYWVTVEKTARGFNLGIGTDCAGHLKDFIQIGVNRLEQEGHLDNNAKITEAEEHLIAFVGGMAYEAKTQNLHELREFTFFNAKMRFCPLWPFC